MPELNPSMKLDEMKKVLQHGRDRSVHCAYGGTKTGMALLMDMRRPGRTLQTELQKTQPGLQAPAFGIAMRDEEDTGHLKFRVNKGVEGHARRLAKTLRGTGLKRVTILFDDDKQFETAVLGEDDEEEAPAIRQRPAPFLATARAAAPAAAPAAQPVPPARPAAAAPAIGVAMQGLIDLLRVAGPDIRDAQAVNLPGNALSTEKQALATALDTIKQQRAQQDFVGAQASVAVARRAAMVLKGKSRQLAEQQNTYDRIAKPLERVRNATFTKPANDSIRDEKLRPGPEFQAFLAALGEFDKTPSVDVVDEIESSARVYLLHNAQLGALSRNTKESKRKKQICEAAMIQARHMRLALQMEQAGPPPWDEETALKAASVRAAFGFESIGQKASVLNNGQTNASAAFWVKGWDDAKADDPSATRNDFLFKPVAGESNVGEFQAGGATPREAVTKSLMDQIGIMTGLDLGVPVTSVVSLPPGSIDLDAYNANKQPHAPHIDQSLPPVGSLQQFVASKGDLMDKDAAFLASIPQSECEKRAMLDILCLNTDRHPGNFLVGEQDGPSGKEPKLIPIDHGMALPTRAGMRERGPDRMNDLNGNVLLKMPGSHKPFSAEIQERIGMLDPDAIEAAIIGTVDAVNRAFPDLGATRHMPAETAFMAKRSASFLKRACDRLSPALVQMALANCQEAIFDSTDAQFVAQAEAVITDYQQQAGGIEDLCINIGSDWDVVPKLQKLGWHDLSTNFATDYQAFKKWFAANAVVAMDAYHNDKPWPGQPPKPTA